MGYLLRSRNRGFLLTWLPPAPLSQALLGDSGSQSWGAGTPDKYGRLDRELQLANSHFIEEQQAQQQVGMSLLCQPGGCEWRGRLDRSCPAAAAAACVMTAHRKGAENLLQSAAVSGEPSLIRSLRKRRPALQN